MPATSAKDGDVSPVLGQNWHGRKYDQSSPDARPHSQWDILAKTMTDIFAESEHPVFPAPSLLASGQLKGGRKQVGLFYGGGLQH